MVITDVCGQAQELWDRNIDAFASYYQKPLRICSYTFVSFEFFFYLFQFILFFLKVEIGNYGRVCEKKDHVIHGFVVFGGVDCSFFDDPYARFS